MPTPTDKTVFPDVSRLPDGSRLPDVSRDVRALAVLELTDDQRYRALKARDARFDGRFIVGVRTTGIYCRPSCPTPTQPLRRNVDFFVSTAAAQRAGLRACKRCRPDASPGSPEWSLREDLAGRAMRLISSGWLDNYTVPELASTLGVTERHLRRITTDVLGAPPLSIARAHRAQTARTLIETTALTFSDISLASGFASLRQFNDTIRAVFDSNPTELRKRCITAESTRMNPPGRLAIRLPFRSPFAARHLFAWWASRSVQGVMFVEDDTLTTALRLERGDGVARLSAAGSWIDCELELEEMADLAGAIAQCRSMLDLDADPVEIERPLRGIEPLWPFVEALPGLRAPGSADGFATLVFAILGQQRSVAAARTIAGRIVARSRGLPDPPSGKAVDSDQRTGLGLAPFPLAAEVAEVDFAGSGLNGRAIDTIRSVAELFVGREYELSPSADRRAISQELLAVKGIGPWTVNYLAMRVFADPDVYLAGDLIADRARDHLNLSAQDLESVRPWRTYLTHHLWAASAKLKESQ